MRRPILFVKNDPVETFGITAKVFADEGVDVLVLDALDGAAPLPSSHPWPAVDEIAGIVMFGGSMNVDETDEHPHLRTGRELTRAAVDGVPYLGICLGAQLLARAMGHRVPRAPVPELGFEPVRPLAAVATDAVLAALPEPAHMFQWHEDTVELPEGATQLAAGDRVAVQAYRVGDLAWGIQFHFEVDADEIEAWLGDFGEGLEGRWGKSADQVRAEASRFLADHERIGAEIFRRFISVVDGRGAE